MLDRFRRMSKSKVGTGILAALGIVILASFAFGDVTSLKSGNFGLGSDVLAKVGGREVSERDMNRGMENLLNRVRQDNPSATTQDLARDFNPLLDQLVQAQALGAFGEDHGFALSKRLVDAEIAKLPEARGMDGRVTDASYQAFLAKQRMTDPELRRLISASVTQRLLLAPAAANARIALGLAQPYASMMLEQRTGEIAIIPVAAFAAGLTPNDADVAKFYAANKARYVVPEQRSLRIARFGPAQVAAVTPTDADIAAYYKANAATYAPKDTRSISQAVVADAKAAAAIAARARTGPFVAAVQPANLTAADVAVGAQTLAQFTELAGDKVAAAAFDPAVKAGTIIGPIQSDLGWHVIRIDAMTSVPGKTVAQARDEIVAKLAVDKRKAALGALVDKIQNALDDGQGFPDVVAKNGLVATETPLLIAKGVSLTDQSFKLAPADAGILKSGFELTGQDAPVVETLPGDAGFALVSVGEVVPAAPAPLEQIRARVASDWVVQQSATRARAAASAIEAKAAAGAPLAQALAVAGVRLAAPLPVTTRRIDLQRAPPALAGAMKMLFSLAEGKSRMVATPGAAGFAVVRVTKIVPGNATGQPTLITQILGQFQQGASAEYAEQFLSAITAKVGVARNEAAISASRQRLTAAPSAVQ